jgi:hypothetical protein
MSNEDLIASSVVGPWEPVVTPMCPKAQTDPVLCDCGFLGAWEHRWVSVWNLAPGFTRGDRVCRRDIEEGRPVRSDDEGWWVIGGFDERCPGCGDIERFDMDANRVADFAEHAKVIVFMDAHR